MNRFQDLISCSGSGCSAFCLSCGERFDTTVVIVSHDHLCDPLWADRILTMEQGRIGEG